MLAIGWLTEGHVCRCQSCMSSFRSAHVCHYFEVLHYVKAAPQPCNTAVKACMLEVLVLQFLLRCAHAFTDCLTDSKSGRLSV